MKYLLFLIFLFSLIEPRPPLKTQKFGGSYSYGKNVNKGSVGYLDVYPETDSTILFYLDLNRGAPSYNMGELYGRIKMVKDSGIFYLENGTSKCSFKMAFTKSHAIIKTVGNAGECPFGYGVYVDGRYKKYSGKIPEYFFSPTGDTIYFKKTSPEKYNEER